MEFDERTRKIKINSGLDILLALLYAKGTSGKYNEHIKGLTKLIKFLFLLEKESEFSSFIQKNYNFDAYDYGPFTSELHDDLEVLHAKNIIEIKCEEKESKPESFDYNLLAELDENDKSCMHNYRLTNKGEKLGKAIFEALNEKQQKDLITFKSIYNGMNLFELLNLVYSKYPDMTTKSLIKKQILNRS